MADKLMYAHNGTKIAPKSKPTWFFQRQNFVRNPRLQILLNTLIQIQVIQHFHNIVEKQKEPELPQHSRQILPQGSDDLFLTLLYL